MPSSPHTDFTTLICRDMLLVQRPRLPHAQSRCRIIVRGLQISRVDVPRRQNPKVGTGMAGVTVTATRDDNLLSVGRTKGRPKLQHIKYHEG
jgi:hypothetical protein